MEVSLATMILLPLIAVAAPLLSRLSANWLPIPLVVFEIALGLVLGPALLGWVQPDEFVHLLSEFGLAMLFFLAGNEINFATLAGRPLKRASLGWLISIVAGVAAGLLFADNIGEAAFIGIALTSTALGTIMPILRDSGVLKTPFGRGVIAVGTVGEFYPLVAITLFLSGRSPIDALFVLIGFVIIAGAAVWFASRGVTRRLHPIINATLHTSGQFAVRFVLLVLLSLVALSLWLQIDMLLGAFTAGILFKLVLSGVPQADAKAVESKIDAVGFGFLVPVFFITTGVTFDLASLIGDWRVLVTLPVFLGLLLIVRGAPSMLASPKTANARDRLATGLFGATGLPIIVAVSSIGVDSGDMDSGTAAALVGAGMLSVLIFPLVALTIRGKSAKLAAAVPNADLT